MLGLRGHQAIEDAQNICKTSKSSNLEQLDTVRLILAGIVVVAHANYVFLTPLGYVTVFPFLRELSTVAVYAFFVLSGFVIGRALMSRRDGFLPYMLRRTARIYPPLLASIAFVAAIDCALRFFDVPAAAIPAAGPMVNGFSYDFQRSMLCLATFGFRGWLSSDANVALWSLAIEMRCYVVAGLVFQIFISKTLVWRIVSIIASLLVLRLILRDRLDAQILIAYLSFSFGILLNLLLTRIPKFLPNIKLDISYSLYIFHYPIMAGLFLVFYQPQFPSTAGAISLALLSLILATTTAWCSAKWIESLRYLLVSPRATGIQADASLENQCTLTVRP